MDDLTFTLRTLCLRNRDGSHATQADRLRALVLMSPQLREGGFRQMRATSLTGKHVDALIARWQAEGLSAGTLKNRVAHLRWWAEKVGKASVIPVDISACCQEVLRCRSRAEVCGTAHASFASVRQVRSSQYGCRRL